MPVNINPSTRHFLEYLPSTSPPPPPVNSFGFVSIPANHAVPAPAPTFVSQTHDYAQTGSNSFPGGATFPLTLTIAKPSGAISGRVLVARMVACCYINGVGFSMTMGAAPAGWTVYATDSPFTQIIGAVYYKVLDGTEGASFQFSVTSGGGSASGATLSGWITCVDAPNTSGPINNIRWTSGTQGNTSITINGPTVSVANNLLLMDIMPVQTGVIPAGDPATTTRGFLDSGGSGTLVKTTDLWYKTFTSGPGATGNFTSTTGWPLTLFQGVVIALGSGPAPTGQLAGFPLNADGVIVPSPIIQGTATQLDSPDGIVIDTAGQLWAADSTSNTTGAIIAYSDPINQGGDTVPDILIVGGNTTLNAPHDVAIGPTGKIFVANTTNDNILIFSSTADGNTAPLDAISGIATGLSMPSGVAVDFGTGAVFVINNGINAVYVWIAGNTGNVAPDRMITGAATLLDSPRALRTDMVGNLWVTNGGDGSTVQFLIADNGNVAPQRRIVSTEIAVGDGSGIALDLDGNIYEVTASDSALLRFLVTDSGAVNPMAEITGWGGIPFGVAVFEESIGAGAPIAFEIQTPSQLLDEGQLAVIRRIFIDINCKVNPLLDAQVITPIALTDGVETTLATITNTERSTVEIGFQKSARQFSLRLTGSLTNRIEVFGIELDTAVTGSEVTQA